VDEAHAPGGGEDLGVDLAGAFGDEVFLARQVFHELGLFRAAQHGDAQLGRGGLQGGVLVGQPAVGDEQDGVCGHSRNHPLD
jgi:hypothetical protein